MTQVLIEKQAHVYRERRKTGTARMNPWPRYDWQELCSHQNTHTRLTLDIHSNLNVYNSSLGPKTQQKNLWNKRFICSFWTTGMKEGWLPEFKWFLLLFLLEAYFTQNNLAISFPPTPTKQKKKVKQKSLICWLFSPSSLGPCRYWP